MLEFALKFKIDLYIGNYYYDEVNSLENDKKIQKKIKKLKILLYI